MPSKSRAQQGLIGAVYAAKKGGPAASPKVAKIAKGMSQKSAKDFASTKHKGLPKKIKEDLRQRAAAAFDELDNEIALSRRPQSVKDAEAAAARDAAPLRSDPNSLNSYDKNILRSVDKDPDNATYTVNGRVMNKAQYQKFQQDYGNQQQDPREMELDRQMNDFKFRNKVKEGGKEGDKYIIKSGPNKGKRWSPDTPGPTNPDYKEIDGNIPSPPDGATAPPPGWKPEKSKSSPATRSNKRADAGDFELDDEAVAEGKKGKKDLTGDGKHNFDDVQAARRMASGQDKKTAVKAATSDKLKEEKYTINGKKVSKAEYEKEMAKAKKSKDKKSKDKIKEALQLVRQAKSLIAESKKEELAARLFESHDEMHDHGEYDDEAGMADNNLETLKRAVMGIDDEIGPGDNLPEWCQEKIAVATDMLITVWDYMQSEKNSEQEMEIPTDDQYMLMLKERLEQFKK
jgi:hypothetical protein